MEMGLPGWEMLILTRVCSYLQVPTLRLVYWSHKLHVLICSHAGLWQWDSFTGSDLLEGLWVLYCKTEFSKVSSRSMNSLG